MGLGGVFAFEEQQLRCHNRLAMPSSIWPVNEHVAFTQQAAEDVEAALAPGWSVRPPRHQRPGMGIARETGPECQKFRCVLPNRSIMGGVRVLRGGVGNGYVGGWGAISRAFTLSAVNCHITFLLAYRHSRGKPCPMTISTHRARRASAPPRHHCNDAWADPSSERGGLYRTDPRAR